MTITANKNGDTLTLVLDGRLDTMTAPQLESAIADLSGIQHLVLDLAKVEYLSSAGLRVLLSAQKRMNAQGDMIVMNVVEAVMEVFSITGFDDILTIR